MKLALVLTDVFSIFFWTQRGIRLEARIRMDFANAERPRGCERTPLRACRLKKESGRQMSKLTTQETVYVNYIATTPERCWAALASSDLTTQYFFGRTVESNWKSG